MMPDRSGGRAVPTWVLDGGAAAGLAFGSLLIGCLVNALRSEPVPWVYTGRAKTLEAAVVSLTKGEDDTPATPPQEVRLEEFQKLVAEGAGLVLDARGKVFYERAHVPGALSLPRDGFAQEYPSLRQKLDAHKDTPLAVYCSGADCPDAQLLADALAKLGFRHLLIYTGGWEEWSQTGLPQEGADMQP